MALKLATVIKAGKQIFMKIAVMASGAGSTFEFLINAKNKGILRADICLLLSDNAKAGALQLAEKHSIPHKCISPKLYVNFAAWDEAVCNTLLNVKPDLVLLAGFLKKIGPITLAGLSGRLVNSHPSLLPKYGGVGMYGHNVHKSVIANNEAETGVTIHLVNENYDEGQILRQARLSVLKFETAAQLEERVKKLEKDTILDFLLCQIGDRVSK